MHLPVELETEVDSPSINHETLRSINTQIDVESHVTEKPNSVHKHKTHAIHHGRPEWYYELRCSRLGPVSVEEIRSLVSEGKLKHDARVWKKGLEDWVEITSSIVWKS